MTISNNDHAAWIAAPNGGGWGRTRVAALALACLLTASAGFAQQPQQSQPQPTITPAFRDADLNQIIEAVAQVTGKTIIPDPRVRAQVTIHSSTPMSPDAFYEAFLSILSVHGFVAVESGNIIKIIPDASARQVPSNDLPSRVNPNSDEFVTQVVQVRNVSAAQLVPVLRPFVPQYGQLVAYQQSNMLIISDRASNVDRMMRIIQRIDQAGDDEVDIIRMENASASDIVRVVNSLYTGPGAQAAEQAGQLAKLVADDRTNSVLISGEKSQRLRLKVLIAHLDTPNETGGDTEVIYLDYADAEQIAGKLKEQVTGITQAAPGQPQQGGGAAAAADRSTTIWADPQTNALVVTAAPKIMKQLRYVVSKLDIRRPQVLIEAIVVEISTSRLSELGVNWAVDGSQDDDSFVPVGTFNQPIGGASIGSIATAINDPESLASIGLPQGLTLGAGRFNNGGVNFAVILRALRNDGDTNILLTPQITTLDNEEAEIKVAQEVPFVTGQFTNTGANNAQGNVNPFQTIQREEVGQILKITPQINEGETVQLKIEQESSSLSQAVTGAVDLVTNKRTISTTVLVEDGGLIVIGGLTGDEAREGESRVPILGSIPILGELFRTRNGQKEKRNLMVFVRPKILRDGMDAAVETNAKYNLMRSRQQGRKGGKVTLLPGERQPLLPPIEDLSRYADPGAGAAPPPPNTDPTQIQPEQPLEMQPSEPRTVPPPTEPEQPRPQPQ